MGHQRRRHDRDDEHGPRRLVKPQRPRRRDRYRAGRTKGETAKLRRLPVNKRGNRQPSLLIPCEFRLILGIEERGHKLVIVQVELVHEVLHDHVPRFGIAEVGVHELLEVHPDAVLVFKERSLHVLRLNRLGQCALLLFELSQPSHHRIAQYAALNHLEQVCD